MLATTILGRLAITNNEALCFLKEQISTDENWRVQEMLAKAFDEVCKHRGYEASLPLIEEWINDDNPNVIRAVTEGLRIWTSRPYFKEYNGPQILDTDLRQTKTLKFVVEYVKDITQKVHA